MRRDERMAHVQGERHDRTEIPAGRIPWAVHEVAWRAYAAAGHGAQSAERIDERGGFSWVELIALLRGTYHDGIGQAERDLFAAYGIPEPSEQPTEAP